MNRLVHLQPLIILAAVIAGLSLGNFPWIAERSGALIVPLLVVMLYGVFLDIPLHQLKPAFRNIQVTGTSLVMNFLWNPVFAWGLGALFLREHPDLWLGLIMLMVTPCTDWYLVFTNLARGNVALATALLPLNLILQLALLPFYILVLAGTLVTLDLAVLLESVVLVLGLPLLLALITRRALANCREGCWLRDRLLFRIADGQILFLSLAIAAMFAAQGRLLLDRAGVVALLLAPVALFFAVNFLIGQAVGRRLRFSYEDVVTFTFTTLARNSPIALGIALAAFPDRPLIALALVIGPLIELPVLGLIARTLLLIRERFPMPR